MYSDLREYLKALENKGMLHRVSKLVDKDWEISALCRRVFQRIPTERRPALLFENVKGFDMPVVAGVLGGSREIYATALGTDIAHILEKWEYAQENPLAPCIVTTGPCKERVLYGDEIDLTKLLPVPIWTVEHDPGPYITAPYVCSKDPETGIRNVGTYRLQLKGPRKGGFMIYPGQHLYEHILKNEAKGESTPVAVVIGADPVVGLVSVAAVPYEADEFAVAGGLRRTSLNLVPCETIPIEVPATSEIVLEGEIPANVREEEGPFGEYTGYMGPKGMQHVFQINCVTLRERPIFQAFVSQMPPSESSVIRAIGREQPVLKHLRSIVGLTVRDVCFKESGGSTGLLIISIKKTTEGNVWEAAWGAWAAAKGYSKITIVVDEDIDIRDSFAVEWALSFRVQPDKDIHILSGTRSVGLDPVNAPWDIPLDSPVRNIGSKVLIDATKKHIYPPIALPPAEHLARIDAAWNEYGF